MRRKLTQRPGRRSDLQSREREPTESSVTRREPKTQIPDCFAKMTSDDAEMPGHTTAVALPPQDLTPRLGTLNYGG